MGVGKVKRRGRPRKPYPSYPLYAHAAGVWAKTIRGRDYYFGPWADPTAALNRYLAEKDHLYAGKAPPPSVDGTTLDEAVNLFLAYARTRYENGEISQRQYNDYKRDTARVLEILGRTRTLASLSPADFTRLRSMLSAGRNATTVSNIIIRVRTMFKWTYQPGRLIAAPVDYGGEFSRPSARLLRKARAESGQKLFTREEVLAVLAKSQNRPFMHAMILLGINCGLGNTDCAEMVFANIDLEQGVLNYPRHKTYIDRTGVLWPETIAALAAAIEVRRKMDVPAELKDRLFVTSHKRPYMHITDRGTVVDSIGLQFRRWLKALQIERRGVGFYTLRHTFQTVGEGSLDLPAVRLIMGHLDASMSGVYREEIPVERLRAVADYVHAWLYGKPIDETKIQS